MTDGINGMQAQLGLLTGSGSSFSPVGIPTPPPQMPVIKTPGEMSALLMQQSQAGMANTLQTTAMVNPANPLSSFAQQYRSNMGSIQSNYLNPYIAQSMSGMMGAPGFIPSMMPSPTMMTPPGMGIYRPFPNPPGHSIPPVPQLPLFTTPFTPSLPNSYFQTPFDYSMNLATQRHQQVMAGALATPGALARGGVDIGMGMLGSGVGALLGARLGGVGGARIGSALGMGIGTFGSELGGLGATAQHIIDNMNPLHAQALRTQQLRGMSPGFIVGGGDLDISGRGLSYRAASQLSRGLSSLSSDSSFQTATGNHFSTQDLTRITRLAGENGLLEMSQSGPQILDQVTKVAKALHTFMKIAGQPDIAEAMKSFGQLRSMGLNLHEMTAFMNEAKMYARMSGTSVASLLENGGLQGAMTFQQAGLTAGLGMRMGSGAFGMAKQAVAGNAFNTAQLALLGGVNGIAQREMESNAAFLKQPMMAASMAQMGAGGTFALDPHSMRNLFNGRVNIGDMATMGANNLLGAVNRGGVGALAMFQIQQGQLQDQIGRAAGPMGTSMMQMQQAMRVVDMLGLPHNADSLAAAFKAMGLDDKTAMQKIGMMNSPEMFKNLYRHLETQRIDMRFGERGRLAAERGSIADQASEESGAFASLRGGFSDFGRGVSNLFTGIGDALHDDQLTRRARRAGMVAVRNPDSLVATADERRMMRTMSAADRAEADRVINGARLAPGVEPLMITPGGHALGVGRLGGFVQDNILGGNQKDLQRVREAEGGLGAIFGGGVMESTFRVLGGAGTGLLMNGKEMRAHLADLDAGSQSLKAGIFATATERDDALNSVAKSLGGNKQVAAQVVAKFSRALAAAADARHTMHGAGDVLKNAATLGIYGIQKEFGDQGQFKEHEIRAVFDKLKASGAIPQNADYNAAKKASLLYGKGNATRGQDAFAARDMTSAEKLENSNASAEAVQKGIATDLFGEEGGSFGHRLGMSVLTLGMSDMAREFGFGGERDRRNEAVKELFGTTRDHDVQALVMLDAAGRQGDKHAAARADELRAKILAGPHGSARLDEANRILSRNKSRLDQLGAGGSRLAGKSLTDINSMLSKEQNVHLRLLERQKHEGTTFLGGLLSGSEKMIDTVKNQIKGTEKDSAAFFPESVKTFDEGAKALLEAAKLLGGITPGTLYDSGVNE